MEFFSLFSTVFFNIAITFGLLLLIYLFFFSGIRARKDLKPVKYISYKKDHFQENFEFTCEYCDNKIRGKSTDEKGCSNCGASCKENLELLVREEENRLEKRHYDEYMKLKDLEWEQNIRNERRDANIDEKYGTPIRFMEKNAKVIALVILLGLMMISVGITVLILKFR